jgi:tRNA pseudouridine13 synthase
VGATPGPPPAREHAPVYLTQELPGVGGTIRQRPEDFLVDEQPAYQPSGEGEHIYLFVEKRNMSTFMAARTLARHFGVHESAVGYAGMKDKRAITRQVFSVHTPGKRPEDFPSLVHDRMGVLWADLHANKLRRGHLAGNRFSIRIRAVTVTAALPALRILQRLATEGVPNRIGEQRFGYLRRNHLVGRAMVLDDPKGALDAILAPAPGGDSMQEARGLYTRGEYKAALDAFSKAFRTERVLLGALSRGATPAQAISAIPRPEQDFFLAAFQSDIFNTVLDGRLRAGALASLHEGDLAQKHDSRGVFPVTPEALTPHLDARLAAFEISPTGPMWGPRMMRAAGETDRVEVAALEAAGVGPDHLAAFAAKRPGRMPGERRALRVPITDPDVEGGVDEHGSYVRVAFDLPRGAFATTVLREIMKADAGPDDDEE